MATTATAVDEDDIVIMVTDVDNVQKFEPKREKDEDYGTLGDYKVVQQAIKEVERSGTVQHHSSRASEDSQQRPTQETTISISSSEIDMEDDEPTMESDSVFRDFAYKSSDELYNVKPVSASQRESYDDKRRKKGEERNDEWEDDEDDDEQATGEYTEGEENFDEGEVGGEEIRRRAVALFDFSPEHENEYGLTVGQVVWISYRHGQGWLVAEDTETGWISTGLFAVVSNLI